MPPANFYKEMKAKHPALKLIERPAHNKDTKFVC